MVAERWYRMAANKHTTLKDAKRIFYTTICVRQALMGQAIHNYGNLQLHNKGVSGFPYRFHQMIIIWQKNLGLIGFYQQTGNCGFFWSLQSKLL